MLAATVVVPIVGKLSDLYGRKPFLLLGVAIFVASSALCAAAASMTQLIVGLGLGFTLPVFNLAVQNAVDMRQVGVATSSMQFLRSIGRSIGAAAFGAVMTARFSSGLGERLTADITAGLPPGMSATLMNPQAMMNPAVAARRLPRGDVRRARRTGLALIMVDIPLRKSNRQIPTTEAV